MRVLSRKAGPFAAWQAGVLAVVFVGAAAGTFTFTQSREAGPSGALEGEQVVVAQIGDLVDSIFTSGTVVFPQREQTAFDVAGEVAEVLVSEGDRVEAGQPLARIDDSAEASLRKAAAEAELGVRDAQEALADALAGPDPAAIARAEDAVAAARLALREAEEAHSDLREVTPDEADAAEETVADAKEALANAEDDLSAAVRSANESEADAAGALDEARDAYAAVFSRWLGITLSDGEAARSPSALLAEWQIDLEALLAEQAPLGGVRTVPPPDDPATVWNETTLHLWLSHTPGTVTATCEDGAPFQGWCAQQEMDDAWTALTDASNAAVEARVAGSRSLLAADEAVAKARDSLADAEDALAALLTPDPLDAAAAEARAALAQADLADAEEALAEAQQGPSSLDLALLRADLAVAERDLADAAERLAGATLTAPFAGVVEAVEMETGGDSRPESGQGNQQAAFIEVVDLSIVEIDGSVDEIDVLAIEVGTQATVTISALAGQPLTGFVTEIGAATAGQTGVVSFPVTLRLQAPSGVTLREGLSATSEIVIQEHRDVLLVPTAAVQGSFFAPVVRVWDGADVEERPVELGPSDDFWVVVLEGVEPGERVLMPETATSAFPSFGFGGRGRGGRVVPLGGGG